MSLTEKKIIFQNRVFIRHRRLENSPSTTQNSLAKFLSQYMYESHLATDNILYKEMATYA